MRSEHKTTADEFDLGVRWVYCYLQRAGAAKAIKRRSHRLDRMAKRRVLQEELSEYRSTGPDDSYESLWDLRHEEGD